MKSNLPALKRQIEMLSMFYPDNKIKDCSVLDLAEKYRVAEITINRDLNDLRSMGIPINSIYGKGIQITGQVDQKTVANLIVKYIAFYHSDVFVRDALFRGEDKSKITSIYIFSSINIAIEYKKIVLIKYKISENNVREILVLPCRIIQNSSKLEFVGIRNSRIVEIYEFSKILSLRITNEVNNDDYDEKIDEFLGKTLVSSSPKINLVLQMKNADSINSFSIYNLKVKKVIDHKTVQAEINHNSLDDLAKWVIQQYGEVTVIEPKEVRDRVIEIAREVVNMHKKANKLMIKLREQENRKNKMRSRSKSKSDEDFMASMDYTEDKGTKRYQGDIGELSLIHEARERYQRFLRDRIVESKIEIELPLETLNIYNTKSPSLIQKIYKWIKKM